MKAATVKAMNCKCKCHFAHLSLDSQHRGYCCIASVTAAGGHECSMHGPNLICTSQQRLEEVFLWRCSCQAKASGVLSMMEGPCGDEDRQAWNSRLTIYCSTSRKTTSMHVVRLFPPGRQHAKGTAAALSIHSCARYSQPCSVRAEPTAQINAHHHVESAAVH